MNLQIKQEKCSGINKQLFQLKTSRRDGLVLQVHHTIPAVSGEVVRIRFVQVAFDDNGDLLSAADHRGNIFIIDFTSKKFWMLPNLGSTSIIAFIPGKNNILLVGTSDCTLSLINTELGQSTGSLEGHTVAPKQVSFTSNGQFCLTASSQEAIIWNLESNSQAHRLTLRRDIVVKQVLFMPVTNNILACFQDDVMHIWKFESFECIKQILPESWKSHHLKTIAFTRNGRAMVIGGHTSLLVVFSLDSWSVKKVIELPDSVSGVRHIEFLPQLFDGGSNKILGLLSSHCMLYFMDIETSTFLKNVFVPHSNVCKFACSNNGKYIACVLQSGEVNIYSTSQLLEAKAPDEPLTVERVDTTTPDLPGIDPEKKAAAQRKSREALKQNLLKVNKQIKETLDLSRLQPILKEFGEYPESYRTLIWKTVLQLPGNQPAFVSLVKRDVHPAYLHLEEQYPLENRAALKNLKRLLSCLTHWSPMFSEVKFLPLFVFPFVKVFRNDPLVCFEAVVSIILNWCQHWFDYFPLPPVDVLCMVENLLAIHDAELLKFYYQAGITSHLFAWTLLETAFSEVLSRSEWLCLWDHILSNEPAFLLIAVVTYNIICRKTIMSCQTCADFEYFFHNQNPIDMKRLLSKTYMLCTSTNSEVHPRQYLSLFKPLDKGSYPVFNQYPKFIVDYKARQMEQIRKEEEEVKKNIHEALNYRASQEKKLNEVNRTELQEKRLQELEETYREMLAKEESRVTEQRKKLIHLRRELRDRELQLLDATKNRLIKQNLSQRHMTLHRLLEDIERKRALQESEQLIAEEEMEHHFMDLLEHKYKLQDQLGNTQRSVSVPDLEHRALQQQQEQLTQELRKLREEATSKLHLKEIDMITHISKVEDLLQQIEVELTKEKAERNQSLASGQSNVKVMKLEAETKKLEREVECLLDELTTARLKEGEKHLKEAANIKADRHTINKEQERLVYLHRSAVHSDARRHRSKSASNLRSNFRNRDAVKDAMTVREELLSESSEMWD